MLAWINRGKRNNILKVIATAWSGTLFKSCVVLKCRPGFTRCEIRAWRNIAQNYLAVRIRRHKHINSHDYFFTPVIICLSPRRSLHFNPCHDGEEGKYPHVHTSSDFTFFIDFSSFPLDLSAGIFPHGNKTRRWQKGEIHK